MEDLGTVGPTPYFEAWSVEKGTFTTKNSKRLQKTQEQLHGMIVKFNESAERLGNEHKDVKFLVRELNKRAIYDWECEVAKRKPGYIDRIVIIFKRDMTPTEQEEHDSRLRAEEEKQRRKEWKEERQIREREELLDRLDGALRAIEEKDDLLRRLQENFAAEERRNGTQHREILRLEREADDKDRQMAGMRRENDDTRRQLLQRLEEARERHRAQLAAEANKADELGRLFEAETARLRRRLWRMEQDRDNGSPGRWHDAREYPEDGYPPRRPGANTGRRRTYRPREDDFS
jgi:hypothetical protein